MCNRQHKRWSERSTGAKVGIVAAAAVAVPGLFAICGLVTMALWNALMPAIFKLPDIGFWQALGLLALSHLLFKGGLGHSSRGHWRRRQVWKHMREDGEPSPAHQPVREAAGEPTRS
jgi:hypothetical protein